MTPKAGDVFEFIVAVRGGSGVVYQPGDTLELIEATGLDPFGQGADLKTEHNWMCKCKCFNPPDNESVWATIDSMFERDLIKKVEPDDT